MRCILVIALIFTTLSVIGLCILTKFSFNSDKLGDNYSITLEPWEYKFSRFTLILMWLSVILFSLLILVSANFSFAFLINWNRSSTIISVILGIFTAFFIINIMGIVFLSRFCFEAEQVNDTYKVALEEWQYNFSRVAIVGLWISHISAIILSSYIFIK